MIRIAPAADLVRAFRFESRFSGTPYFFLFLRFRTGESPAPRSAADFGKGRILYFCVF
jgi:hypothetical protein